MTTAQEMLAEAMLNAELSKDGAQPLILMNMNLDPERIADISSHTVGEVGSAAHDQICDMCDKGWVMFRVQTEFCSLRGHITMAYFAKMKTS